MDTEEAREIAHHQYIGRPETDEGPYYHESWWEAYKGGVKGLLGGLIIGGGVGAIAGVMAAGAIALILGGAVTPLAVGGIVLGFSAFGAYHGASEFAHVGIVTGAVSAAQEIAEDRLRDHDLSRFAELKREIVGIKEMIKGKTPEEVEKAQEVCEPGVPSIRAVEQAQEHYRTQHCDDYHCPPEGMKPVFWKVGLVGLLAGAAGGALLGWGGVHSVLSEIIEKFTGEHAALDGLKNLSAAQTAGISAVAGGAIGASFGINRDLFRGVFDTTDRWFKGILVRENGKNRARAVQVDAVPEPHGAGLMVETPTTAQESSFFRDKLQAEAAQRALVNLDPNAAIRH